MEWWILLAYVCGTITGAFMLYVYEHDNARRDDGGGKKVKK